MPKILTSIPHDLLEQYRAHAISSAELGKLTGFHPAAIRRAIERPPKVPDAKNKTALIGLHEFRDWLTEASSNLDNFRTEAIAQDAEDLKSRPALGTGVE